MMIQVRRYAILVGFLAAATLVWMTTNGEKAPRFGLRLHEERPFGVMEDVFYVRTLGGETQATVQAANASYFQKKNDAEMQRIEAKFLENTRETRVQAERGSMNLDTRQGELVGNVVGRTSDGMVLRTPQLGFDTAAKRLFTDQAVLLEGVSFTLQGVGADVDLVTQKAGLRQKVEGTTWSVSR